jgi:hypothetical protein
MKALKKLFWNFVKHYVEQEIQKSKELTEKRIADLERNIDGVFQELNSFIVKTDVLKSNIIAIRDIFNSKLKALKMDVFTDFSKENNLEVDYQYSKLKELIDKNNYMTKEELFKKALNKNMISKEYFHKAERFYGSLWNQNTN